MGVKFFEGYTELQVFVSLFGVMLFIGIFSLGFTFLSVAIAITMESPEGMRAVITLLTIPFFFATMHFTLRTFFPYTQSSVRSQSSKLSHQWDQIFHNRKRFLVNRNPL